MARVEDGTSRFDARNLGGQCLIRERLAGKTFDLFSVGVPADDEDGTTFGVDCLDSTGEISTSRDADRKPGLERRHQLRLQTLGVLHFP